MIFLTTGVSQQVSTSLVAVPQASDSSQASRSVVVYP